MNEFDLSLQFSVEVIKDRPREVAAMACQIREHEDFNQYIGQICQVLGTGENTDPSHLRELLLVLLAVLFLECKYGLALREKRISGFDEAGKAHKQFKKSALRFIKSLRSMGDLDSADRLAGILTTIEARTLSKHEIKRQYLERFAVHTARIYVNFTGKLPPIAENEHGPFADYVDSVIELMPESVIELMPEAPPKKPELKRVLHEVRVNFGNFSDMLGITRHIYSEEAQNALKELGAFDYMRRPEDEQVLRSAALLQLAAQAGWLDERTKKRRNKK